MRDALLSALWCQLRDWLLAGDGSIERLSADLAQRCAGLAGLGVAVYERGRQLACRVTLGAGEPDALIRLLRQLREELPVGYDRAVVLVSLLEPARIVSVDDARAHGVDLGNETLALTGAGRVNVILAHVPCLNSWSSAQFSEALIVKHGGGRPLEFHACPTRTLWIARDAALQTCRAGLSRRRADLDARPALHAEIRLVADFLRDKSTRDGAVAYAYDAWRDRSVDCGHVARKAMALAACRRAARALGDSKLGEMASEHLARLAAGRPITGDIHDAHLLLAGAPGADARAASLRVRFRSSGMIESQDGDEDFFPGVAFAALAGRGELRDLDCAASLEYYSARFRRAPRWPAVWWQMQAWSAVGRVASRLSEAFVFDMAEWVLARQAEDGAFAIAEGAAAPTFQTACVAEGLLAAARTSRLAGDAARAARYSAAARRGLGFAGSLVLDPAHADLFPRPASAIGGVRTWHGELVLRIDVAAHYLGGLVDLAGFEDNA